MGTQAKSATDLLTQLSDAEIRDLDGQVGRNIHLVRIQCLRQNAEPLGFAEMKFVQMQNELKTRGLSV
jgi:hypothetical protein